MITGLSTSIGSPALYRKGSLLVRIGQGGDSAKVGGNGGLHGANRLGGNSLAEILIFGKRAGMASINYSNQLKSQVRSDISIRNAHHHINKFINKGTELAKPLQHELTSVMWNHCGVIKDKELLESGLKKVKEIRDVIKDVDVRIDCQSCDDLIQVFVHP